MSELKKTIFKKNQKEEKTESQNAACEPNNHKRELKI